MPAMDMTEDQRAEFHQFMEDWKRGYDLSWQDLKAKHDRLQDLVESIHWTEGSNNRVGLVVIPVSGVAG